MLYTPGRSAKVRRVRRNPAARDGVRTWRRVRGRGRAVRRGA
ncbi:hypothetical protein [Pseudonocardia nigra]|nr:hypothetical protein [Pseudonocardia nigra]